MHIIAFALALMAAPADDAQARVNEENAKAWAAQYDQIADARKTALTQKDPHVAALHHERIAEFAVQMLDRIARAKKGNVWNASLVFKTKDGSFKGEQLVDALQKLKARCDKDAKAAAADAKAHEGELSPKEAATVLRLDGTYLAQLRTLEADGNKLLAEKKIFEGGKKLEQASNSAAQLLKSLPDQRKRKALTDASKIEVAGATMTGKAFEREVKLSAQRTAKAFADVKNAYLAERSKRLDAEKAAKSAKLAQWMAKHAKPKGPPPKAPTSTSAAPRPAAARPVAAPQPAYVEEQVPVELDWSGVHFADGECSFSNCVTDGWVSSTGATTMCSFSNCLTDGWRTDYPDGSQSTTMCNFSNCMVDGWIVSFTDGRQVSCTCPFSDCRENEVVCD